MLGCVLAAVAWQAAQGESDLSIRLLEISAVCLTTAGAVVSADYLLGRAKAPIRSVNWVGTLALLAGLAVALPFPDHASWNQNHWWITWPLPSYGVALLTCLIGRAVLRSTNVA